MSNITIQQISWVVLHGKKLWRTIWFPTLNIHLDSRTIHFWVYVIRAVICNKIYDWVGTYLEGKNLFEAHIFNFSQEIYGEIVEIILLKKLRENKKFDSFDALRWQITQDKFEAENIVLAVLTFWSFDHIHPWHEYYLKQASKFWNTLITVVASDENIERIKWKKPDYTMSDRIHSLNALGISDIIEAWSNTRPMQWLEKYKPFSICLGYDQRWKYVDSLPKTLKELWLSSHIITIKAFQPEIFKSSLLKQKNNTH